SYTLLLSPSPTPPSSTLFPYTTLFRSLRSNCRRHTCRARTGSGPARPCGALNARRVRCLQGIGVPMQTYSGEASDTTRIKCAARSEEHTSELQSRFDLVCRLLLEKKKK